MLSEHLNIAVTCPRSFLFPAYAGNDIASCEVRDLSRDSLVLPGTEGGTSLSPHQLVFTWEPASNASNETIGWDVVLGAAFAYPVGGQTVPFTVEVKATPLIATQDFAFVVHVDYFGPNNHHVRHTVPFLAEVDAYDFAVVSVAQQTLSQRAGQDEIRTFEVIVQNVGVYPDSFTFTIKTDADIAVTAPPNLYVPPGETRSAYVHVLTPHGKLYEIGRSVPVNIKVASVTGSGVYGTVGILQIRGPYLPLYWLPLLGVALVSAGVVVRGSREKLEHRRAERGRPRRVELTPRQAVLLAELKRTDREKYKEKRRSLDSVYKERLQDYREHRKERLAADRAEAKQAHLEFLAAKKARKAKRTEEKRAEKFRKEEERAAAKLARKEAKREAKIVKKKEKVLKKTRARLEKERAKAEKREAKLRKKEEAAAAKQAKADAKAQKKAEKEAAKKK